MEAKRRVKTVIFGDSVEWVLVRFSDDKIISDVLKLGQLETLDHSMDGVEADLQEGDLCLAPYKDKHFYEAKVVLRTEDKERALKEHKSYKDAENVKRGSSDVKQNLNKKIKDDAKDDSSNKRLKTIKKSEKTNKESTALVTGKRIFDSGLMNQFDTSQSKETEGKEKSQEEERESVPMSQKEKNPLCSILAPQKETVIPSLPETATNTSGTNFTAALGATSQVDNTPLTTTWELCNRVNENVMQNAGENIASEHNGQIPVPTPEVLQILQGLCRPDVQDYIRSVTVYFNNFNNTSNRNQCLGAAEQNWNYPQTYGFPYNQPYTSESGVYYSTCMPGPSSQTAVMSTTFEHEFQDNSGTTSETGSEGLRRSPRKKNIQPAASTAQRSPQKTYSSTPDDLNDMVKLLDSHTVRVEKNALRQATSSARKATKPGFTLCYKLLSSVFSVDELACSRGQGITPAKKGDLRPALDRHRISAIKDYTCAWCKKNGFGVPLEQTLNDAVTERVSYARKQRKSKLK